MRSKEKMTSKAALTLALIVVALVLVGVVNGGVSRSSIPRWARSLLRRRSTTSKSCLHYTYSRCNKNAQCLLKTETYQDTAVNFKNVKYGVEFLCLCKPGYETYYPNNPSPAVPNDGDPPQDYCNAGKDPCRTSNPCGTKSADNKCVYDKPGQFKCICTQFWEGQICQNDVNECLKEDRCKNDGTCQNQIQSTQFPMGYSCICKTGTTGANCEEVNDPCARSPCLGTSAFGGAVDSNPCVKLNDACTGTTPTCAIVLKDPKTLSGYKCTCKDGWGGQKCEMRTGGCDSNPCAGRGTCEIDNLYPTFFKCICYEGYSNDVAQLAEGRYCTKVVNLCDNSPCKNEGTCVCLGANNVKCVCKPGFVGPRCETQVDPCYSPVRPKCLNGGKCTRQKVNNVPSGTKYSCDCTGTGFTGTVCETDVDECTQNKCDSTGSSGCTNLVGSYDCHCKPGFIKTDADKTCKEFASGCDKKPCLLNGVCAKGSSQSNDFSCSCVYPIYGGSPLMEGTVCQTPKSGAGVTVYASFAKTFSALISGTSKDMVVTGDASIKRSGGLFGDPYAMLNSGTARIKKEDAVDLLPTATIGAFWLYFKSCSLARGNLMTVWDASTSKATMEIRPTTAGDALQVCFPNAVNQKDLPVVFTTPKFSKDEWNYIGVFNSGANKLTVVLNSIVVYEESLKSFGGVVKNDIVFGANNIEGKGPYFGGDISNFMVSNHGNVGYSTVVNNIMKWANPNCVPFLDLPVEAGSPYRDGSCMRLDASPVGSDVPALPIKYTTSTGKDMTTTMFDLSQGQVLVENFNTLFVGSPVANADKYGIMFEFKEIAKPTTGANNKIIFGETANRNTFFSVSTIVDSSNVYMIEFTMKTTAQVAVVKATLAKSVDDYDRLWRVVVSFDGSKALGSGQDNFIVYTQGYPDPAEMSQTYSIQGKLSSTNWSGPLKFGSSKKHMLGSFRFYVGSLFDSTQRSNFFQGKPPGNIIG